MAWRLIKDVPFPQQRVFKSEIEDFTCEAYEILEYVCSTTPPFSGHFLPKEESPPRYLIHVKSYLKLFNMDNASLRAKEGVECFEKLDEVANKAIARLKIYENTLQNLLNVQEVVRHR